MRIAILTLPLHTNYGGILQAYALQTVLERMGHEVKVLSRPPYKAHNAWVMPIVYLKRVIQKVFLRQDISILYDGHNRIRQNTDKFIRKYIHSHIVTDWGKLEGQFDAYVVGSDQIWRPKYAKMFSDIPNAFLSFTEGWDIKRIAYAVSFGTDEWEYSDSLTNLCKQLVRSFDRISVRENCGIRLCKEHLEVDATHVLDPTMLLSKNDYLALINAARKKKHEGGIMCYILDSTAYTREIINHYERVLLLQAFHTNSLIENPDAREKDKIQKPVEHWLQSFCDADFVITDSFHACVFSIIFRINFAVIINEGRGSSRIYSLLETTGLQDRIIRDREEMPLQSINYDNVYSKLNKVKEESMAFIQETLS